MDNLRDFDVANYLDNKELIAEYISEILQDGDMDELLSAIDEIARAKGMAKIAQETGLSRESLYKTFKAGSRPGFETVLKVLKALGIQLQAVA